MKKLKSYLLIALSACMLTSCLDKFPQDEIPAGSAITTIEDANQNDSHMADLRATSIDRSTLGK